jgi:lipoprotein-releasing system ATP-binding protein
MPEVLLHVDRIAKSFTDEGAKVEVLRDVSFSMARGEMAALLGVSGAGKTTLLQILGGLDKPTGGTVAVSGRTLGAMAPRELARFRSATVGFVFQFHHLLPDFTALENTLIPGMIAGTGRRQNTERARELLGRVGLSSRLTHYPAELSGGERQRVALARALFNRPALVLADEPTGNLDAANGESLLKLFVELNQQLGQTILVATHNERLARGLGRAVVLQDGRVVEGAAR